MKKIVNVTVSGEGLDKLLGEVITDVVHAKHYTGNADDIRAAVQLLLAALSPVAPPSTLTHDQGLAIAKALRGEISHGKLADILGIMDKHAFKQASGAFDETSAVAPQPTPADRETMTVKLQNRIDQIEANWSIGFISSVDPESYALIKESLAFLLASAPSPAPQPDAPTRNEQVGYPKVRGRCPSCGADSLFLGSGGYVTCSVIGCKNPGAPTDALAGLVK